MSNIVFHKNVLDENLINHIKKYVIDNKASKKWQTSMFWPEFIQKTSTTVSVLSLDDNKKICKELRKIYNKLIPETKKMGMEVNYYIWPPLSYIPFHDDSHKQVASTIYLNKDWHIDWGGLFLYKEKDKILAEVPEWNKLIIQTDKEWHCTTSITRPYYLPELINGTVEIVSDMRTTLQIFVPEELTEYKDLEELKQKYEK